MESDSYATLGMSVYACTLVTYLLLLAVSLRGTVLDTKKRWLVPIVMQILFALIACECATTAYGTYLAQRHTCGTGKSFEILLAVVVGSYVDLSFTLCCLCFGLSWSTKDESNYGGKPIRHRKQESRKYWWGDCCNGDGNMAAESMRVPPPTSAATTSTAIVDDEISSLEDRLLAEEAEDHYEFDEANEREGDSFRGSTRRNEQLINAVIADRQLDDDQRLFDSDEDNDLGSTSQTWSRRCVRVCTWFQCATCGLFGGINGTGGPDAFQQVAVVLAGWFKGLDLVPSDIVAALFLMRAEQREMESKAVETLLQERSQNENGMGGSGGGGLRHPRRRMFTHVGRWMWVSQGVNERANSKLHAQRIRESRDARRIRTSSMAIPFLRSRQSSFNATAVEEGESLNTPIAAAVAAHGQEEFDQPMDLDPEAREVLLVAADMAPYMIGMSGWLLYSWMHGIRGWAMLCCAPCFTCSRRRKTRCCGFGSPPAYGAGGHDNEGVASPPRGFDLPEIQSSPSSPGHMNIQDDGLCSWNTRALLENAGRSSSTNADVVYASFTSFIGQTVPYCVCVDHTKRRVIIAIRGTMTISDAITDVTMVPVPLFEMAKKWNFQDEVEPDSHVHAGILRIAAWMRNDLQNQDVLHQLFGLSTRDASGGVPPAATSDSHNTAVATSRERAMSWTGKLPDCRGYGLEITGHSLGAGVAVVLSLFLRPVFPNVHCLAFSPPGCVFDWKLANRCSAWVSCVFVGKDYSPRMSWHSLFKLRGQILDTLRRCKVNKFVAIASSITCRPVDRLLYDADSVPDSQYARDVAKKIDELASRNLSVLDSVRLYAPGKLLHLMKDETVTRNCCRTQKHYIPMWIDDRSALDEILLSTRMALDHFPDMVDKVLKDVVDEFCPSRNGSDRHPF